MVRMNITMPDRVAQKISKFKNKSRFITEALEEKIVREERKQLEKELIESYKKMAEDPEEIELMKDWDCTTGDGIE